MAGILTENNHQITDAVSGSPGIVKKPQAKMTEPNGISKPLEVATASVTNGDCLTTKVQLKLHISLMSVIECNVFCIQWFLHVLLTHALVLVSRGQTAFFRFYLWWRKKGSGMVHTRISS